MFSCRTRIASADAEREQIEAIEYNCLYSTRPYLTVFTATTDTHRTINKNAQLSKPRYLVPSYLRCTTKKKSITAILSYNIRFQD